MRVTIRKRIILSFAHDEHDNASSVDEWRDS